MTRQLWGDIRDGDWRCDVSDAGVAMLDKVACRHSLGAIEIELDGWAGGGMALEYYQHKAGILEQHCEAADRDPAEIRRTLLMPCYLTEDKQMIDRVVKNLGPGSVAGSRQYIVDRIGEFKDAGISEIIFGGIASGDIERLQQFESEIVNSCR